MVRAEPGLPERAAPRDLEIVPEGSLATVKSVRGKLVHRGLKAGVLPTDWKRSDRAVVIESHPRDPGTGVAVVVDVDQRRRLGSTALFVGPVPKLGLVSVLRIADRAPGVLHLADGRLVVPNVQLPNDESPRGIVVAEEESDEVWVVATSSAGKTYGAPWVDPTTAEVELSERLPVSPPTFVSSQHEASRWTGGLDLFIREPAEGSCQQLRLVAGGSHRCLKLASGSPYERVVVVSSDYYYRQRSAEETFFDARTDTPVRLPPPPGDPWVREQSLASLPRALFTSRIDDGRKAVGLWWSPDRAVLLDVSIAREPQHYGGFQWGGTVWSLEPLGTPSETLLDAETGAFYRTPPLERLGWAEPTQPIFFATMVDGDSTQLLRIDTRKGTRQVIARYGDCPRAHHLFTQARSGSRLAVGCFETPDPDNWLHTLRWSEVIDLDAGWRTRTKLMVETVLPDGRVLVSSRRTSEGGMPRDGDEVWWLDINPHAAHGR